MPRMTPRRTLVIEQRSPSTIGQRGSVIVAGDYRGSVFRQVYLSVLSLPGWSISDDTADRFPPPALIRRDRVTDR